MSKRQYIALIFAVSLIFGVTSCETSESSDADSISATKPTSEQQKVLSTASTAKVNSTQKVSSTPEVVSAPSHVESTTESKDANTYLYESVLGYTLELPNTWKDRVIIAEDDTQTMFCYAEDYNLFLNNPYDDGRIVSNGGIFSVVVINKVDSPEEYVRYTNEDVNAMPYKSRQPLGEFGDLAFFFSQPTGFKGNTETQEMFDIYAELSREAGIIKDTFKHVD